MPAKRPFEEAYDGPKKQQNTQASFRPLLPKKGWQPLQKPLQLKRNRLRRGLQFINGCPVLSCNAPNCRLRTHLQYSSKSTPSPSSSSSTSPSNSSSTSSVSTGASSVFTFRSAEHELALSEGKFQDLTAEVHCVQTSSINAHNAFHEADGLPEFIAEIPAFREMFDEYFNRVYDRLSILHYPPPVNPHTKQACFVRAMTSPAYCLNALACVENEAVMRKKGTSRDPIATILYSRIISILREQVANFATAEIDNLLLIICNLALFDVVHHNFSRLDVHRKGMVQLVNKAGGVHNLESSMVVVLNLDRMIATYTGQLPIYAQPIDRCIRAHNKHPEIYGAFFKAAKGECVDHDVYDYCNDVSRALELFEGARISFDLAMAYETPDNDVHYFYFARQRVADHFALLNHKYWELPSRSRCVLLAARIVDYIILADNYVNVIPGFLASQVKETLDKMKTDDPHIWNDYDDVLLWIFFVIGMIPEPAGTDDWVLEPLKRLLVNKYGSITSLSEWMEDELASMKQFVWCSSRLDGGFRELCHKITGPAVKVTDFSDADTVAEFGDVGSDMR